MAYILNREPLFNVKVVFLNKREIDLIIYPKMSIREVKEKISCVDSLLLPEVMQLECNNTVLNDLISVGKYEFIKEGVKLI